MLTADGNLSRHVGARTSSFLLNLSRHFSPRQSSSPDAYIFVRDANRRLTHTWPVSEKHARLVYSTSTSGKCPVCGWPQRDCQCSTRREASEPVPSRPVAKLRVEKTGRGGKTVTVVFGLPNNQEFLNDLAKDLKRSCGTGGTTTDEGVELQGDLRDRVRATLAKRGFVVKG